MSRRLIKAAPTYSRLDEALDKARPDYVVIANETGQHIPTLTALAQAGYDGTLIVEKPLAAESCILPPHRFAAAFVGYQLRFHPVLQALRDRLADEEVIAAQAYVGQYLPDWRPGSDYRTGYSAQAKLGGGALRDLSHELDYLGWLFGPWRRLAALGGRLGGLEIESDDCWGVLIAFADCPLATLQLNYLDRVGRRELVIVTKLHTYRADLNTGQLDCDGEFESFEVSRDSILLAEHDAALSGETSVLCSLAEGLAVVKTVEAIERSAETGGWIEA